MHRKFGEVGHVDHEICNA